ncbi:MAG: Spy/CpxP family protein refolding chaperone [Hylemonella sp.]|nr:Spy/CpxP family protein refolding chaperone [Hylemonella sp.]
MKPWIKRSLIALTSATVVFGGLTACSSRGDHARGWSDERVTEMRGKAVEKISEKLELNAGQKAKLEALADEMVASRKVMRGESGDVRTDLQALIAGDKFDRSKAQQMLDQKTRALQGSGPKVLAAFGDFYDSLNPEQQKQVRERLERRGHGWWGRG